ncbi:tetratricopeptide repeat protein [Phenylobacterium sp.]|uniref:O-linked N-acetylglucosamine transferase, SPINDLY family protein n=1 Tax=Phenylobacterium sp. TaxID=1871053 RepID=UPI002F3FFA11
MSAPLNLSVRDPIAEGRAALAAGDPAQAAQRFAEAVQAQPADHESRYWLYSALVATAQPKAAAETLNDARNLHAIACLRGAGVDMARIQDDKGYCAQVGLQLYAANMMGPASFCLGRALDVQNLNAQTMVSYGLSLQHQGRSDEAAAVFQAGAELFNAPQIHEFMLYSLFHAPDGLARVSQEARRWADLYAAPHAPAQAVFANDRSPERKLRVGYVGPSFTRTQVAQFLLPVLEAHDPDAVEVFLYCADPAGEAALPDHCRLRAIDGVPDAELADMIRADRIDILIDTWGHNAGSRLTAFARRPAPIQIAWINFVQTTGLSSMDYVFHADSMDIPGTDQYFTETVWRLGPIMAPFRPHADRPDLVRTPALKNGYVTFASFNNPAKLSEMTVAAWSLILRARPADRLVLKYAYFEDPVLQRATRARFAAYGAEPEQLEFRGHSKGADYLREFQDIDLALDPSPCPGGTTSCDALANGVPVLTNRGEDFYARIGVPVLEPCGLTELIAADWDDYVAKALDLTADFTALNALRGRIRPALDASPYRDEAGFTRKLEAAFRQMFARWLEAQA